MKRLLLLIVMLIATHKLQAQQAAVPLFFEKAYLHTDREQYTAGEDIWFKAYLVNAQTNQLLNNSNNLYVELIAPGGVVRNRQTMRIDNGTGHGDFRLSDSLYAGTYRLRAYTNWMRNFGDNFVFEKEIRVYGGKKLKPKNSQPNAPKANVAKNNKSNAPTLPVLPPVNLDTVNTIRFFPEGGSMVENIGGLVAFKAEDGYGRPLGIGGVIETGSGEQITTINAPDGSGAFTLVPLPNTSYYAVGRYSNGSAFKTALPQALLGGLTMHVAGTDSTCNITICADQQTLASLQNKQLTLTGKTHGKTYKTVRFQLTAQTGALSLSKSIFPQGVTCFTLYDDEQKPHCERLVYIDRPNEELFTLSSDKQVYTAKEKTTLTIKAAPNTNLSVAVTDAGLIPGDRLNIASYLNLKSELRGAIANVSQYFDEKNPNRKQLLDLLLMTQGWRDFVWRRLADSALRISYLLEKGISISGHVKEVWSEKPAPDLNITLFADSARGTKIFTARSDKNGDFFIDGMNLYGNQKFSVNAANNKGKHAAWIDIDTVTHLGYPTKKISYPPDTLPSAKKFAEAVANRVLVTRRYKLTDTIVLHEVDIKSGGIPFGKKYADTSIAITRDKYRFQTLGAYVGMLYSRQRDKLPKGVPFHFVFTIDTVPHWRKDDTAHINFFQIPLDQILSIHVRFINLAGEPLYADVVRGFIYHDENTDLNHYMWVDIAVKPHAFDKFDFHTANRDIDGYYNARTFYSPKHDKPTTKPDLRTTIHWEPNITTNDKGEATVTYYNADPKTKVRITAQGITENGVPVVATATYDVK